MREQWDDLSRQQRRWLDLACKVAESSVERQKHGAVVVKNGNCVSVGHNKFKNNPEFVIDMPGSYSRHAEIDAISRAGDCKGATIYVARVSNAGPALSRPCNSCAKAIISAGIQKVIYTI